MFIAHVNRFCVKHAKTAGLAIAVVIILPFVFLYGPGRSSWSGDDGGRRMRDVGTMYGEKIDPDEFLDHMTAADISASLRWGMSFSSDNRYFPMWIDQTLRRIRGVNEAGKRGLDNVSDAEVAAAVQKMWRFMDGEPRRFSNTKFAEFKKNVLARRGMSVERFDQMVREDIMIERLEAEATAGVFVSPDEVREEFDRSEEEFVIKYANVGYANMMKEASIDPTDEEAQAYFDEHREELRLSDQKRVRAVLFPLSAHVKEAAVTEEEKKAYYEENKEARYTRPTEKTYEQVKGQIAHQLRQRKMSEAARDAADGFHKKLIEAREAAADKPAADLFTEVAEGMELIVKESGAFREDDNVVASLGRCPIFCRRAYALTQDEPYTIPVRDGQHFYVGSLLETIPGEPPEELDEKTKNRIVNILTSHKAVAYYQEKVEPFRKKLDGKTPDDSKSLYQREVQENDDIAAEEKQAAIDAYNKDIENLVVPYFEPVKKRVVAVEFKLDAIKRAAEVTEDEVKAYYDENSDEYNKEEVKARHILLKTEGVADDEKPKLKEKLEGLRKEVLDGADFAALAKKHSEDTGSAVKGGDLGYFGKGKMVPPFEEAAFALEAGGLSGIVESQFGYHLIKVEEKRAGQKLEAVAKEIREKLVDEKVDELAREQARTFADLAYQKLDEEYDPPSLGEDEEDGAERQGKSAGALFTAVAAGKGYRVIETGLFRDRGMVPKIGFETEFAKTAHRVSPYHPLSEIIKGRNAFYVACWLETKDAYLPKLGEEELALALADRKPGTRPDDDPGYQSRILINRVKYRMKREAALEMARTKAQEAHDAVTQKVREGATFEEATKDIEDVTFTEAAPFKGRRSPPGVPEGQKVVAALEDANPETMLEPIEMDSGSLLVYVASRTLPSAEDFEKQKEATARRLRSRKQGEARRAFYERLEEESETVLARAWGGKGEEEEE